MNKQKTIRMVNDTELYVSTVMRLRAVRMAPWLIKTYAPDEVNALVNALRCLSSVVYRPSAVRLIGQYQGPFLSGTTFVHNHHTDGHRISAHVDENAVGALAIDYAPIVGGDPQTAFTTARPTRG